VSDRRRVVSAPDAPDAVGPYSHTVAAGGLLFCSGQIPLDPAIGERVEGGAAAQAMRCLENLEEVCRAAGASLGDAARLTVYLTDLPGDWAEVNEAYGAYFESLGAEPPARLALGVAALPKGAGVEIEAVVALPD
jgi:2-iminobutanoate/2-iminopropanoate deaminase